MKYYKKIILLINFTFSHVLYYFYLYKHGLGNIFSYKFIYHLNGALKGKNLNYLTNLTWKFILEYKKHIKWKITFIISEWNK